MATIFLLIGIKFKTNIEFEFLKQKYMFLDKSKNQIMCNKMEI
jgi:hypothetical protein